MNRTQKTILGAAEDMLNMSPDRNADSGTTHQTWPLMDPEGECLLDPTSSLTTEVTRSLSADHMTVSVRYLDHRPRSQPSGTRSQPLLFSLCRVPSSVKVWLPLIMCTTSAHCSCKQIRKPEVREACRWNEHQYSCAHSWRLMQAPEPG